MSSISFIVLSFKGGCLDLRVLSVRFYYGLNIRRKNSVDVHGRNMNLIFIAFSRRAVVVLA